MLQTIKRIVAAILLLILVLAGISHIEILLNEPEVARVRIAHSLIPHNSADVAFVGSSKVFTGVVPQLLMDEYGIAAINANSPSELFSNSLLQMKSLLRTQKPKVIVCELMGAATPYTFTRTLNAYANSELERTEVYYIDTLRMLRSMSWLNPLKYSAMLEAFREDPASLAYATTLALRHDKLFSINQQSFARAYGTDRLTAALNHTDLIGAVALENIPTQHFSRMPYAEAEGFYYTFTPEELESITLHQKNRRVLEEMLHLSKKHSFELVFLMLPQYWNDAELKVLAELEELAVEGGAHFIHSDTICVETGIVMAESMTDLGHLNADAALTVTHWLGDYLTANFELPDRSVETDARYAPWQHHAYGYDATAYARYLPWITGLDEYVDALTYLDDSYLILMATNGHEVLASDEVYNTMALEILPLENAPFFADELQSALAIWSGDTIFHDELYEGEYSLDLNIAGNSLVFAQQDGRIPSLEIFINTVEQDLPLYSGLHFIVYDMLDHAVVDHVCFDLRYSVPHAIR